MTESEKIFVFKRKLEQLKEEESKILSILKDVRKQIKKYEVEELQTCSECWMRSEEEDSDSDESVSGNKKLLLEVLDCAEIVNNASLNLGLSKVFGNDSNEENEESDESDV